MKRDNDRLRLRQLYESYGYTRYKMSKFEEYDLYVANKDFLASDRIITFTDTDGRLMALKPDVTLSIVKSGTHAPHTVQKVYYQENVYRTDRSTRAFREIMQMGLECIGDLDFLQVCEVILLAESSLRSLSRSFILDLSHMGCIRGLMELLGLRPGDRETFLGLLQQKNSQGMDAWLTSLGIEEKRRQTAHVLTAYYGRMEPLREQLRDLPLNDEITDALAELSAILDVVQGQGRGRIHIDLSIAGDMSYYNGVLLRGYIDGIPSGVLSGGRYDDLVQKMGREGGAIGFAINLDLIENFKNRGAGEEPDADVLLLYDEKDDVRAVLERARSLRQGGLSVTLQKTTPPGGHYSRIERFTAAGSAGQAAEAPTATGDAGATDCGRSGIMATTPDTAAGATSAGAHGTEGVRGGGADA